MRNLPAITLVLGGARSGKSRHAESLLSGTEATRLYIATGEARDPEMTERIREHRHRRSADWRTIEEPLELTASLSREVTIGTVALVDCLTLWLGNLMGADRDVGAEIDALLAVLPKLAAPVVLVSNEVGQGIVPDNAMAREFRDHAGRLHQQIAAVADRVDFVTAGLVQRLK
jgi:adenosylcobinamide kinase/adenosylcobinamide-phosphate guanylyltransferase